MTMPDRPVVSTVLYTESGVQVNPELNSYSAAVIGISAGSVTTDVITITGSASKTVRVRRIVLAGIQTLASHRDIVLIRRSSANSGGTSTTSSAVSLDTNNPVGTAVVRSYTANAAALGTAVGNVSIRKILVTALGGSFDQCIFDFPRDGLVLRGVNDSAAINLNTVASAGLLLSGCIEWTEE